MRLNYNFAFKNSKLTPWERPAPPNPLVSDASFNKKIKYISEQFILNKELFFPSTSVLIIIFALQIFNIFPNRQIKRLEVNHNKYQTISNKLSNLNSKKIRYRRNLQNIEQFFSQPTTSYLFAYYLQNAVPKGVQINSYSFGDNGFDINVTAYNLNSLNEFITLLIESPVIIKSSVNINKLDRLELNQSKESNLIPDLELEIYGRVKKLDVNKREDLYIESKANGLLEKLQRFNYLKQKLGS